MGRKVRRQPADQERGNKPRRKGEAPNFILDQRNLPVTDRDGLTGPFQCIFGHPRFFFHPH